MNKRSLMALIMLFMMVALAYPQTGTGSPGNPGNSAAVTNAKVDSTKESIKSDTLKPDLSRTWGLDIKGHGNSYLLTVIGMGVVFFALTALYLTFAGASKLIRHQVAAKQNKANPGKSPASTNGEMNAEVNAAIAMALYQYFSADHDQENAILTINRVSRMYSPWSSKIYNLRHHPRNW